VRTRRKRRRRRKIREYRLSGELLQEGVILLARRLLILGESRSDGLDHLANLNRIISERFPR